MQDDEDNGTDVIAKPEEKPRCLSCQKRGIPCQYGLQLTWANEVVEVFAADDLVWTQLPKQPAIWTRQVEDPSNAAKGLETGGDSLVLHVPRPSGFHFVNVSSDDISIILRLADGHAEAISDTPKSDHSPPPRTALRLCQSPSTFHSILGDHEQSNLLLLDYYVNNWCRRKVLIDGPENGYRQLVLPVLPSSSSLKHAILALAAIDYPQCDGPHDFRSVALRHKSISLRLLQQNIQKLLSGGGDATGSSMSVDFHETVLTTLIMCISDITTGSTKEWVTHLHGASALFSMVGRRAVDHRLVQFCRQYFLIRDVFSGTALDTESYFTERKVSALWANLLKSAEPEDESAGSPISVYVGCSERLVDIISSITALAREKYKYRQVDGVSLAKEQEFLAQANALQYRLDQLREECRGPDGWFLVDDTDYEEVFSTSDHSRRVILYSLLFKRAAQLYLRHAGFDIPVTHPSIQQVLLPSLLKLIDRVEVQEREVYPMWPLFIASCMAVSEQDRRIVLDQFKRLRRVWPLGNIGVTESSVHWVWKWHDIALDGRAPTNTAPAMGQDPSSAVQLFQGARNGSAGVSSCVDWDAPLRRLGWRISLT
ncbi:fungal-specific transcription factor domain-containing protein [Xylariales sp. PMI_506]|nr:fungal-specific transcription factor domain-containing protein [Xylariales sp. PMI_506]